ncbi:polyhydroxyalkanoic acid inclusion protein PhaP [Pseudalkalibacillus sp. A8]|uniref:polyhydroxyalkanoic acid inclusion protein PhaP n=1 Tax=Pseudalkalibacillus sp. A8 TaxID=3382641 RepID=UPI0038B5A188
MAANKKSQSNDQNAFHFVDSFWDSWKNGLNFVYDSQKEVENLTLQAFEHQREAWEKVTDNMSRIEDEQKKLMKELRQTVTQNIENVSGEELTKSLEQSNERLDEVISRVQQLTVTPYKASLNVLSQSQQHFQESIKSVIGQQQKNREELKPLFEDFLNQVKTTQKGFYNVFENNTKTTLSRFN